MTLTFCRNLWAADWVAHSDLPWPQLVGFGPAGFDSYARLRLLPDPARPGQSENDVEAEDWRIDQLPRLFEVLAHHTTTPEDCYFCVWEGIGAVAIDADDAGYVDDETHTAPLERPGAQPAVAPEPAATPMLAQLPKVVVPHRAYWLFRGPLADVGTWDTARGWPGRHRLHQAEPAFVWPRDHAWCVAKDVDPHWAGIGGPQALISRLTTDAHLDAVHADPTQDQPVYQ